MQIVIDISEELYKSYKSRPPMLGDAGMDMIAQSIANGTPLPKGHGDLIDRKDLLQLKSKWYHLRNGDVACPKIDIEHALTIIEADKESEG